MNAKPTVLISASAIGYYGNRGDEMLDEGSARVKASGGNCEGLGSGAGESEGLATRVVLARFGIILAREGGALPKMVTPFQIGIGRTAGKREAMMSWIALQDVVGIFELCLERTPIQGAVSFAPVSGALNVVSPQPVTNAELRKSWRGRCIGRDFPCASFRLRLALGTGNGRRAANWRASASYRKKLQQVGYTFSVSDAYACFDRALQSEMKHPI